jgi:hypothetical protein
MSRVLGLRVGTGLRAGGKPHRGQAAPGASRARDEQGPRRGACRAMPSGRAGPPLGERAAA